MIGENVWQNKLVGDANLRAAAYGYKMHQNRSREAFSQ